MSITVKYLGILAEVTGKTAEELELSGAKKDVMQKVLKRYPGLEDKSFVTALNGKVTHGDSDIREGDRISLIPPAPGG